jgi:glycosyltransferase involved in cell wall biosynthesis
MQDLKVSLIITTYNWPEALSASLSSVFKQTKLPYEVIVADDGSAQDTEQAIKQLQQQGNVEIIHSWQQDKGFRLAKSRNKAIAKARGDYIILIDGDIILDNNFIEDHSGFIQDDCFVQGTRVLLSEPLSQSILENNSLDISIFTKGIENKKNCLRSSLLARLCSFKSRQLKGIKTCNFAFWKKHAIRINGFNEEFVGWGREDSEFTARLLNSGIGRQNIKFKALGYHLYHPINTRERLEINNKILHDAVSGKSTWCTKGIDQYL